MSKPPECDDCGRTAVYAPGGWVCANCDSTVTENDG